MLTDPMGLKTCDECTEEAYACVNEALLNEGKCLKNVAIAYGVCVAAVFVACALAGPGYAACVVAGLKICTEAATAGVTYCGVVTAAELAVCKIHQSQCYKDCCP